MLLLHPSWGCSYQKKIFSPSFVFYHSKTVKTSMFDSWSAGCKKAPRDQSDPDSKHHSRLAENKVFINKDPISFSLWVMVYGAGWCDEDDKMQCTEYFFHEANFRLRELIFIGSRRQMGRTSWLRSPCSFCVGNREPRMEIQCYKHKHWDSSEGLDGDKASFLI